MPETAWEGRYGMDQERFDGEQQDERAAMLAALETPPPFSPEDFPGGDEAADDGYEAEPDQEPERVDPDARIKELEALLAQRDEETASERSKREDYERRQREQEALNWGQQLFSEKETLRLTNKAEKIAAKHGLPEEEVETLVRAAMTAGGDESAIEAEAKRLKAREAKYEERARKVEEELKRQKAESARRKLAGSPVNRVGQGNRTAPSNVKKGTREHLAALLG